jgi:hypothetical protein
MNLYNPKTYFEKLNHLKSLVDCEIDQKLIEELNVYEVKMIKCFIHKNKETYICQKGDYIVIDINYSCGLIFYRFKTLYNASFYSNELQKKYFRSGTNPYYLGYIHHIDIDHTDENNQEEEEEE